MVDTHKIDDTSQGSNGSNITTTNSSMVTEEERQRYLDQLQAETTITMIPAMVFLMTLVVVGLIGNSLVIVVYSRRKKWSATTILMVTMAFVDLLANVVAIPGEIYEMLHVWQFENRALCRAHIFSDIFSTLSSGYVLLAISVVRYRKVCQPYNWQVTPRGAKIICASLIALGSIFSIPFAIINGRKTRKTSRSDIVGFECTIDDEYVDTIWPMLSLVLFVLMYIVCCGCLIIMYVLIGREAWRHRIITGARGPSLSLTTSTLVSWKGGFSGRKQSSHCRSSYSSSSTDANMSAKAPVGDQEGGQNYHLRVFTDRTEVQPSKVDELFTNLQKEMPVLDISPLYYSEVKNPELYVLDHVNCEKSKHESEKGIQNNTRSIINETTEATVKKERNKSDTKIGKEPRCILPNVKPNRACTENIEIDFVFREGSTEEDVQLHDVVSKAVIISHSRKMPDLTNASSGDIFQNRRKSSTYDRQPLHKEDVNYTYHLSVSKLLDFIHCPDEHDISLNSNTAGNEANVSFQLSLIRNILQSAGWLSSSILDMMRGARDNSEGEIAAGSHAETKTVNFSTHQNESEVDNILQTRVGGNMSSTQNRFGKTLCISVPTLIRPSSTYVMKRRKWNRITIMLVIISAIYTLGYFPYLGLLFVHIFYPETLKNMSTTGEMAYNLLLRTFFLNCAVNPIVYSLCDNNFRKECNHLFKRSYCI